MKPLTPPQDCMFFTAILASDSAHYDSAEERLIQLFGKPAARMAPARFDHTRYYQSEMGSDLLKGIIAFSKPFSPDDLAGRKMKTRRLEWELGIWGPDGFQRKVNIDPGYVALSHVALATSKNFAHRICIGQCIYAEITLIYHPGGWEQLAWTYPDYKSDDVQSFLTDCRTILKRGLSVR